MEQAIGSNENVSRLADAVLPLVSKYHIEKVWLFGSRARGTEHESSDFDVCILPSEQFSFSDHYYFEKELSEILNSEVHVMTRGALESEHDQFYNNVVRDEILVYG
ncbi:nucleotidyltransferase family protein [Methanomethylophilus alvi]|uniref:nucleotidyltransferase family protein n=1 Tax=Methanomethylophilus alvi TaxID=1291540 RepID=UPI0037DCD2FA